MGLQNTDNPQALTTVNKEDMQYNIIADISYLNLQKQFKRPQIPFLCTKDHIYVKKLYLSLLLTAIDGGLLLEANGILLCLAT